MKFNPCPLRQYASASPTLQVSPYFSLLTLIFASLGLPNSPQNTHTLIYRSGESELTRNRRNRQKIERTSTSAENGVDLLWRMGYLASTSCIFPISCLIQLLYGGLLMLKYVYALNYPFQLSKITFLLLITYKRLSYSPAQLFFLFLFPYLHVFIAIY